MARSKAMAPAKTGSQAITQVDAELSKEIADIKRQIGAPSSNSLKLDNKGTKFIAPDGQDLGNEIQVVVVDFVSANRYYESTFDSNNVTPPVCYAYGRVIDEMAPDPEALKPQSDACGPCRWNQWKSDVRGTGKACKNTRELALLYIDPNDPESADDPKTPLWRFSVPPTGLKSFDGFVNGVLRGLNGPPIKAVVTMTAVDMGTYTTVAFSDPVPNPQYAVHFSRRGECEDLLIRKPDYSKQTAKSSAKPTQRQKAVGRR